jgi:hypothetical protein
MREKYCWLVADKPNEHADKLSASYIEIVLQNIS